MIADTQEVEERSFAAASMIRTATVHDVPRISEIINSTPSSGGCSSRATRSSMKACATSPSSKRAGKVLGCTALAIIWADLAEVRSLAVDEEARGQGIGRKLTEWCIDEARRLQIRRLMSLTYEQAFFEKLGFEVVNKDTLPLKVWSDCVRCPKREGCDEIAMVRTLHDVPIIAAPRPRRRRGE
jgi:amino-acid N-acetyltransferase